MSNCVTMPSAEAYNLATETLAAIYNYRERALEVAIEEARDCKIKKCNLLRWFLFKSASYIKHYKNDTDDDALKLLNNIIMPGYFDSPSIRYHIKRRYDSCEWLCQRIVNSIPNGTDSTVTLDFWDSQKLNEVNKQITNYEEVNKSFSEIKGKIDSIYQF